MDPVGELKLYLVLSDNVSPCVIAATSADEARRLHPDEDEDEESLGVRCLGFACENVESGVVCASYTT